MEKGLQAAGFFKRAMLALFFLVTGSALFLGAKIDALHREAFLWGLGLAVLLFLGVPLARRMGKLGALKCWLLLTALCLGVKLWGVWAVRVPPASDYQTFWLVAEALAKGTLAPNRYVALFPHILGYSGFLSVFFRIFGTHPLLPPLLNVFLTACAGSGLFLLCKRWFSLESGCIVYFLWILCPSQTLYNSLVLSEPLYTALQISVLLLVTEIHARCGSAAKPVALGLGAGALCGLLLRGIQMARPIAAIPLVALVIWLVFLNPRQLLDRGRRKVWLPFAALAMALYFLTGPVWQQHMAYLLGEPPSTTPGFSLLVGFNQASEGRWSQEDSDLLLAQNDRPGSTAQGVQEAMLEQAKARITSGGIDFPQLFKQKLRHFLGLEDAPSSYCAPGLSDPVRAQKICNAFYFSMMLLSLLGVLCLWQRGVDSPVLFAPLWVIGLTLAHMLVEVAGRYHYSLVPFFLIAAAAGLTFHREGLLRQVVGKLKSRGAGKVNQK